MKTESAIRNDELKNARKIIKAHADEHGCRYKIARGGSVHYYGTMTNSNNIGWHLKSDDWRYWNADITEGRA